MSLELGATVIVTCSSPSQIGGIAGFNLHQLVGVNILPLLALLFLISWSSPEFPAASDGV
ncbi:MAG TPA: hypothetical protein VI094_02265 [Propionibacteriaceae bacterium]